MKIFVAIPTYDAKCGVETIRSLLNEQAAALTNGDDFRVAFLPGCSLITMGRNQLVDDFLKSDCDRLVFIDSDLSWEVGSLLKIAHHEVDFVGGAYRYKQELESYPIGWTAEPELWTDRKGLLKVDSLPGGFMSLSRDVFEILRDAFPDRTYEHFGHSVHCYFHAPFADGRLYGEDSAFCKDWRDLGGHIYLDPELSITHWDGARPYPGHIGNWLKSRMEIAA